MKTKEKPIFLSKNKKIQLFKNINVNLKCVKAQKIKLDIKINQNITNKILHSNPNTTYNNSIKTIINNNFQKSLNIINVKKLAPTNKTNNKRSKSTKSFSMNNSNKSNLKRNFIIKKRDSKKFINNITHKNSSKSKIKSEYYKKIKVVTNNNSSNKTKKSKNNSNSNKLSPINRPIKLIRNNAPINQSNPMELTFGSSSFMSNNIQTETNETDKDKEKNTIKIKNKFRRRNNSFMKTINSKKGFKSKNNLNIKKNKIVKLNKKLILRPSWKISSNKSKYKPPKSLYSKEPEKIKEDKNNKSAFLIENYNKKTRYSANSESILYYKNNNITDINSNKNSKKDIKINIRKFNHQDKNLKYKFINFYKKNLLRNKIFNNRNEIDIDTNNNYGIKKINIKSYSYNDSSIFDNNLKYKNNNINTKNKNNKLDDSKECIIKINKSVDKENGTFKLIIKRTVADKCIRKMPKSTPKLLLTHPSFKKLFF